jgi:glycine cleavage system regulatory protein
MMKTNKPLTGILSIRGCDRIGTAAVVSSFLVNRGANILEENVQVLGDFFSGMLLFTADEQAMCKITAHTDRELREFQPKLELIPESTPSARSILRYALDVLAESEARIPATIQQIIGDLGINVTEIRERALKVDGCKKSFYSGTFRLEIGNANSLAALRQDLSNLEHQCGWEVDLRPEGDLRHNRFFVATGTSIDKTRQSRCWHN